MPATIVRALGYTGTRQVFTWPSSASYNNKITAYLWGGGGGGGGNDAGNVGGAGSGGCWSKIVFSCAPGDVVEVSVGSAGTGGGSSASYAYGGNPGISLSNAGEIFNSSSLPLYRVQNGAYCTFLNNYGVWDSPGGYTHIFDYSVSLNFALSGYYTFDASVDNYGYVYLDGVEVCQAGNFFATYSNRVFVPAGTYTLRMYGVNTGGPGSFGLSVMAETSFSGGWGGRSGRAGSSGGGGGGGGATVIRKNNTIIGVAGGGGGGGGAGIQGGTQPANAPGPSGQAGAGIDNGSDGGTRGGDGGGGGGGGGGYGGGNGGDQAPYDTWGYAGYFGGNLGATSENPSGRVPGGTGNPYWTGGVGYGGANGGGTGNPGYAVLEFEINGTFLNSNGTYYPVNETWVKDSNVWKRAVGVYLKKDGVWQPVDGTLAPNFTSVGGAYGYASRKGPSSDDSGGDGGTGGGGKIICTKLYELGLMSEEIYLADQAFGAELVNVRPDIYNGYRAWAEIVVDWMDGQGPKMMPWMSDEEFSVAAKKWSTTWAQDIATPWAEEMAYQMGVKDHGSLTGRMITAAGIPICKAVGVWQRVFGPSKRPAGFGKGLMLIPIFVMFKFVAELGRAIEKIRN
jgi:hypothetical protein